MGTYKVRLEDLYRTLRLWKKSYCTQPDDCAWKLSDILTFISMFESKLGLLLFSILVFISSWHSMLSLVRFKISFKTSGLIWTIIVLVLTLFVYESKKGLSKHRISIQSKVGLFHRAAVIMERSQVREVREFHFQEENIRKKNDKVRD